MWLLIEQQRYFGASNSDFKYIIIVSHFHADIVLPTLILPFCPQIWLLLIQGEIILTIQIVDNF